MLYNFIIFFLMQWRRPAKVTIRAPGTDGKRRLTTSDRTIVDEEEDGWLAQEQKGK